MAISQSIRLEIAPDTEFHYLQLMVHLEKDANILLQILDDQGSLIWTLFSGALKIGSHVFPIQTTQLGNGPYLVRAKADGIAVSQLNLNPISLL